MKFIAMPEVSKEVKVDGNKLFFGDKEVENCMFIRNGEIAKRYVVRVWRGGYWGFVTGLDLHDGGFWLGGCQINVWKGQSQLSIPRATYQWWEEVKYVLDNLCVETAGKEWKVFEEEDFDEH